MAALVEGWSIDAHGCCFLTGYGQKVYVQHRMLEKSKDLYQWLQEGACVYVCGDEKKMAHDVHSALGSILEQEGRMSPEEARNI